MEMAAKPNRLTQEPGASNGRMAGRFHGPAAVLLLGPLALCLSFVNGAAGQSAPPFKVQSLATGQKPLGVAVNWTGSFAGGGFADYVVWVAVANSGDNSVSVFPNLVSHPTVIGGIPSPYSVTSCGTGTDGGRFLLTSPSANSVSLIDARNGRLIATFPVGQQPYAADCTGYVYGQVVVSNYGDSSLSVISVWPDSFGVTKTIPNVPGSRGLHGIVSYPSSTSSIAWVAGTDADVVTKVDLNTGAVIVRLPVRRPTTVYLSPISGAFTIASSFENSIVTLDTAKLLVTETRNVPNPQDLVASRLGGFVSSGVGAPLTWLSSQQSTLSTVTGAVGLAAFDAGTGSRYDRPSSPPSSVLATSPDSNSVYLIQEQEPAPPLPSQFGVADAARFGAAVAPGSLASIFATTGASQSFSAGALPIPVSLGGVSLNVGGSLNLDSTSNKWTYSSAGSVQGRLLFVSPSQINFQVPPGIAVGTSLAVQLTKPDGSSLLTIATFVASAPGIFTLPMNGQGQGAVLNQDNTVNFGTNPARRGSVIQIFATGAGETTPALAAGEAAPASGNPLVLTKVQPTMTIGGKNAKVQFSGMAPGFVGLWQINAEVPADVTPGFAVPLVITAAGATSNTVTIAVQ